MCSLNTQLVRWFDVKAKVDLMFCPPSPALYIRNKIPSLVNHNFTRKKTIASIKKNKEDNGYSRELFFLRLTCVWYGIRAGAYYIVFSMLFTPLMYVKTIEKSKTNARTQATQLSDVNTSMVRWACCQSRRRKKRKKKKHSENYTHLTIDRTKT